MAAIPGHDAVLSSIGHKVPNDPWLVSEAASVLLTAMDRVQVKRFVIVSGGLLFPSFNPAALLLRMMIAKRLADARAMEKIICGSDADWTIVRPPHLKIGVAAKGYKTKVGGIPNNGWSGLQFTDLAACLLDTVEAENTFGRLSASPRRNQNVYTHVKKSIGQARRKSSDINWALVENLQLIFSESRNSAACLTKES